MFNTSEALSAQIRLGEDNRLELIRSQTRLIRFDEQPVVQALIDVLDKALCRRFLTPRTRNGDGKT